MDKVLVYIAGPFRAKDWYNVEKNIRNAEALSVAVANTRDGFPQCPHTMGRFLSGAASDNTWIVGDLEWMRRCDAVLVTPDYHGSSGTLGEIAEATRLGMPIYYADVVTDNPHHLPGDLLAALGFCPDYWSGR